MELRVPVTVGILTFNSVGVVERAIRSVARCDEVIVCDGGSTDGTQELAISHGCRVVEQDPAHLDPQGRLTDIAGVREQVLGLARHAWVFFLDSDELATPQLVQEIAEVVGSSQRFGAYEIPRLYVLDGEVIRCAMTYPSSQVRLVNRSVVSGYHGLVHDVPVLGEAVEVGALEAPQLVPQPPFRDLWRKWRAYMRLEEVKRADLSRSEWSQQVLRPQLRVVRWLAHRYYRSLRSCRGTRLPARYEIGRLAYELGVVVYTGRRFVGVNRVDADRAWG